jgi:hypothetical protein
MSVIVSDKNGVTDGSAHAMLQQINSPIPIVLVAWSENFVFNDELLSVKDFILVDYCEYGYDWDLEKSGTHIWGINSEKFPRYYNGDWVKFDNWVKESNPKILFKRELLKCDATDTILPIEYANVLSQWPIQTKEDFNNRPLIFSQYWGRSNECRIRIQGDAWHYAFKKGFQLCDNVFYINEYLKQETGTRAASFWIPHYARVEIGGIMAINNLSKLSLSWPGAGFKCFRTVEASVNSVLVQHKNNFAWQFDWDETNCILVEPGEEFEGIDEALNNPDLYEIYLNSVATAEKYRLPNYINHLERIINERT